MTLNISNMPPEKQERIETDKQAAFMIHQLKNGKVTRADVQMSVNKYEGEIRDYYRERLNHYKGLINGK